MRRTDGPTLGGWHEADRRHDMQPRPGARRATAADQNLMPRREIIGIEALVTVGGQRIRPTQWICAQRGPPAPANILRSAALRRRVCMPKRQTPPDAPWLSEPRPPAWHDLRAFRQGPRPARRPRRARAFIAHQAAPGSCADPDIGRADFCDFENRRCIGARMSWYRRQMSAVSTPD